MAEQEFIEVEHPGIEKHGKVPRSTLPMWAGLGWKPVGEKPAKRSGGDAAGGDTK